MEASLYWPFQNEDKNGRMQYSQNVRMTVCSLDNAYD